MKTPTYAVASLLLLCGCSEDKPVGRAPAAPAASNQVKQQATPAANATTSAPATAANRIIPLQRPPIQYLPIGEEAPEIEGRDVEGETFKLSDYRGKVVVLDFWGDW